MTAHLHDPAGYAAGSTHTARPGGTASPLTRPRWLLPAVAAALVAGGLVLAGVLPLSTVLYAGVFGGMLLMHMGGHGGHGGHGGGSGQGGGHAGHSSGTGDQDLNRRSSGSQSAGPGSNARPDDRAADDTTTTEARNDQHSSHGCH